MASANGNAHTSPQNATAGAPDENHVSNFWSRYEHAKYGDVMKNVLIEVLRNLSVGADISRTQADLSQDVISRYEYLMQKHSEYVEEHKQEREFAKSFREREKQLQANILHLQRIMVSRSQLVDRRA